METKYAENFEKIAGTENLLEAWREFLPGKRGKRDVQEFQLHLVDNLFALHEDLIHHTYRHGGYQAFKISDPKPRDIHKATVRDRLVHHAIHRVLYPFFEKVFASDTFSCRVGKGTHAALSRFRSFLYVASKNHTKSCWVLKCDIRKFFANIDHEVLLGVLRSHITDADTRRLVEEVVNSFSSGAPGKGLPLGNLTSQLFVNVYMNRFDQFVKHRLRAKYYLRYADDFIVLSDNREWLEQLIPRIKEFLEKELRLALHADKVLIKTVASGIDFLGWVQFPDHRVLRAATRRRMMRRIRENPEPETIASYRGLLSHGNTNRLRKQLLGG